MTRAHARSACYRHLLTAAVCVGVFGLFAFPAATRAGDIQWHGGFSEYWHTLNNWHPFGSPFSIHRVPTNFDTAILANPANDFVVLSGSTDPINGLTIGNGIDMTTNGWNLTVDNAGSAFTSVSGAGSTLIVTDYYEPVTNGPGTFFSTDNLLVAAGAQLRAYADMQVDGATTLLGGATMIDTSFSDSVTFLGDIEVDNASMELDEAQVTIGPGVDLLAENNASVIINAGAGEIPVNQGATFRVRTGADATLNELEVGFNGDPSIGTDGTVIVDGAGSFLWTALDLGANEGAGGTALVSVSNQAHLRSYNNIIRGTGRLEIDPTATFELRTTTVVTGGELDIQQDAEWDFGLYIDGGTMDVDNLTIHFEMDISSGGTLNAETLTVTGSTVSPPSVDVTDGVINVGAINIGSAGTQAGTLKLTGTNASVSQTAGSSLNLNQGSVMVLNQAHLDTPGEVVMLDSATLTIDSGGTASIGALVSNPGANPNVRLSNPVGASALLIGQGNLGGTYHGTIEDADSGPGGFTKVGNGLLDLTGANTYSGGTIIDGGAVLANNTVGSATGTGSVIVNDMGTLGGNGQAFGHVIVNDGGSVSPGNSVGVLTVGDVTFNPGGSLIVELAGPGGVPGADHDQLIVNNTATVDNGATLDIQLSPGFSPVLGNTFHILTTNVFNGTFDNVLGLSLPGNLTFDLQYGTNDLILEVVTALIPGDLNGDGFVGIADLNIVLGNWNQNVTPGVLLEGDPSGDGFVGIEDLNTVLGNWNAGTPPASSIPEPAGVVVLISGLLTLLRRDRA